MQSADRRLGLILIVVAIAWLRLVQTNIPDIRTGGEPGPRAFPFLLGVALAVLGAWMLGVARAGGRTRSTDTGPTQTIAPVTRREIASAGGVFLVLILYAFLLDTVGFVAATPVVMALTLFALTGARRWRLTLALAAGFTLGCWTVFDVLLGTPLP